MDQEKLKQLREYLKVLRWDIHVDEHYYDEFDAGGPMTYILVRKKSQSAIVGQCDLEAETEEQLLENNAAFIEKWYHKQDGSFRD